MLFSFFIIYTIILSGGETMKLKLIIDKKYVQTQIHICNDKDDLEVRKLYQIVNSAVNASLTAYDDDKIYMLPCAEIIHIYTQDQKVFAATKTGTYRIRQRMYELEEQLDQSRFLRVSNSEIVNLKKIKHMDTSITGTIRMYLDGDLEAYVSRRYVGKIKKALGI